MERVTVTDLARYSGLYVDRVSDKGRPLVVMHHGKDVAVLLLMELYRTLMGEEPEQLSLGLDDDETRGAA